KTRLIDPDQTKILYLPVEDKSLQEPIPIKSNLPKLKKPELEKKEKSLLSPKTRKIILYGLVLYFVLDTLFPEKKKEDPKTPTAINSFTLEKPKILAQDISKAKIALENGLIYYQKADYQNYLKALDFFK